ncbi:MAG: hypothetical protein K6G90_06860 [Clostridia bacterium]|nr:hypothetical protein [Clostridia bacterium]
MDKFIPYEKLSKKKKRELDLKKRKTWAISPVTRKPANPKAYNRQKARRRDREDFPDAFFMRYLLTPHPENVYYKTNQQEAIL